MMPNFGRRSAGRLETCDPRLQEVMRAAIREFDFSVLHGHRSPEEQIKLYAIGRTTELGRKPVTTKNGTTKKSKHNYSPSKAIDVAPYPVDFNDTDRIRYLAGYIMGVAAERGVKLKWGGDWDRDFETNDNTFEDLLHFEVIG